MIQVSVMVALVWVFVDTGGGLVGAAALIAWAFLSPPPWRKPLWPFKR